MFDKTDTLIDRICGIILLTSITVGAIWWVGFALPERDTKLWAIHECYVSSGCEEALGAPSPENSRASQCWADCTEVVAHHYQEQERDL